jgi:hypothetical protein
MSVAIATSQVPAAPVFMTARNGNAVDDGAGEATVASSSSAVPVTNRYPVIAFSYDREASRLVLLYRDPTSGATVSQIPTEVALKQYEESARKEKQEQAKTLYVVGGDETKSVASPAMAQPGLPVVPNAPVAITPPPAAAASDPSSFGINLLV